MINKDRIIPITETDLLSVFGTMLIAAAAAASGTAPELLEADNPGQFTVTAAAKTLLANEPVETLDFAATATSGTVYFVPAYNYTGFKIAGTAVTTSGAAVDPQSHALYKAVLATGAVTITCMTPVLTD